MLDDDTHNLYDAYYFAHCCGMPYIRNDDWLQFFDGIAKRIIDYLHPETVLDAGCAMGFLVEAFRDRGVDAKGLDVSEYALEKIREDIKPFCRKASITELLHDRFDLITCIEVLEHLSPKEGVQAITNLCGHCDNLLFSSTPFDYSEPTHRNVQPPEYWAELFAAESFYRDVDFDASFITSWAVLYRKARPGINQIVNRYERKFWSLWKENVDLRDLASKYQKKMAKDEQRFNSIRDQLDQISRRFNIDMAEENFGQQMIEWVDSIEAAREKTKGQS